MGRDGRADGCIDIWMEGLLIGCIGEWRNGCMDGCIDEWMDARTECIDRWMKHQHTIHGCYLSSIIKEIFLTVLISKKVL